MGKYRVPRLEFPASSSPNFEFPASENSNTGTNSSCPPTHPSCPLIHPSCTPAENSNTIADLSCPPSHPSCPPADYSEMVTGPSCPLKKRCTFSLSACRKERTRDGWPHDIGCICLEEKVSFSVHPSSVREIIYLIHHHTTSPMLREWEYFLISPNHTCQEIHFPIISTCYYIIFPSLKM